MKHMYTIYTLLLITVTVLLLSCKSGNQEAYRDYALEEAATADSISLQETFQSDSLSEANLRAFEDRAIQKLHDVMDLIEILSNPKNEPTFRAQAKTMLLGNFEKSENTISLILPDTEIFKYSIEQFADSLFKDRYVTLKLKIIEARVHQSLTKSGDDNYQGKLFLRISPALNHKTFYPKEIIVEIFLKKTKKDFGVDNRSVWEVFLGDFGK